MRQLERIIVGHDLREGGKTALQVAIELAKRYGAALRLVHVVEPYAVYQRLSHPLTHPYSPEELSQKAGEQLGALVAKTKPELSQVEYEVRRGKPFVELIRARHAWHGDLIVVGGTAEGHERFLGSTGERVLRKALVPALVVKTAAAAAAKTLLVPTDFSACAQKAANEAIQLAANFGSRIRFVHALEPLPAYAYGPDMGVSVPPPILTPADIEEEWQAFLATLSALDTVPWERHTIEDRAITTIVGQAEESQAELIVMGTHGRSGLAHMLLGSVAEGVVRAAPCSVLTIRPDAFQFELP